VLRRGDVATYVLRQRAVRVVGCAAEPAQDSFGRYLTTAAATVDAVLVQVQPLRIELGAPEFCVGNDANGRCHTAYPIPGKGLHSRAYSSKALWLAGKQPPCLTPSSRAEEGSRGDYGTSSPLLRTGV
jgi:hypothetical protein